MYKVFEFTLGNHQVKIMNHWRQGAKLYIDGECRDQDSTFYANGKRALLGANLGELGRLEIHPLSTFMSVEMDGFLVDGHGKTRQVYSSHKRLSLKEKRLQSATVAR
ncbi:hypothetical protein [Shewanella sp. YIC-542]|uniref:hypothetical protein n=1 Tax=Shewanella mytili TaxID=3377111 RepID=UPI00398EFA0D